MQILLGVDETIVKINSKSISIDYIQQFISTHFLNRKICSNYILIPKSDKNCYHRTFLLKWLYSLYAKNNRAFPELKDTLLHRHRKAIKIITTKKIIHTISYKVIDTENIQIQIQPANNNIAYTIKTFLQTKIIIMPTYLQISFDSKESRELLEKFITSKNIINVPHLHQYNRLDMKKFIAYEVKEEILTPIQSAYIILGISENDDLKTVKKRYKSLAKEFHPDRVDYKDKARLDIYTKKFQAISGAYEVIISN